MNEWGVRMDDGSKDLALDRQIGAMRVPAKLIEGNRVTLLPTGAATFDAMFTAIAEAETSLHLEYYEFEDVHWRGQRLIDLLVERLKAGVRVALSYDGAGSDGTDDELFDRLRAAGAEVFEFHPFSPLRRHFKLLELNDRDHRKILVADGRVAILGGVNLSRVYENPQSAGAPADAAKAFWYDAAALIEGPAVAEIQLLFLQNWRRQSGGRLSQVGAFPALEPLGDQTIRTDGSAPRERKPLFFESLKAALRAAQSHVLLATGYFVPTRRQWRLLAGAAERGVQVDLILAGYSDNPSCVRAARALYGPLLKRGVRIHEMNDGMLHAKVATIDGVWTAIGSSNLDRRSYVFNNEVDAIVLGRETAEAVETILRGWMSRGDVVSLAKWQQRSSGERFREGVSRLWSGLM